MLLKSPEKNPKTIYVAHITFAADKKGALFDNIYFLSVGKFIQIFVIQCQ